MQRAPAGNSTFLFENKIIKINIMMMLLLLLVSSVVGLQTIFEFGCDGGLKLMDGVPGGPLM
jgi:hypothetical protein